MAKEDYPPNWANVAQDVKKKAAWKCENCGHKHQPETGYTLTVHHIDGDKDNADAGNLVALCQRCHLTIQGLKNVVMLLDQKLLPFYTAPKWVERARKYFDKGGDKQ